MFKYTFGIKKTLLESHRCEKNPLIFGKTSYHNFVLAQSEFLRLVEAQNKFLILVIIYSMFKYTFGIKTTLLESHWRQKSPLKARFRQN